MKKEVAFYTDPGVRKINEDFVSVFQYEGVLVALVADGLGGHENGEQASKIAVETVESCFRSCPEVTEENIRRMILAANDNVLALQNEKNKMRSTIVALFIGKEKSIVAHVGDSRLYVLGRWSILYQTEDHSVSQMAVKVGEIKKSEIRFSPDRSKLLRSLGTQECVADVKEIEISENRIRGFVLCSDGFWQNVTEKEMMKCFRKKKAVHEWLESMIGVLEEKKDEKQDNYSVVTIKLEKEKKV